MSISVLFARISCLNVERSLRRCCRLKVQTSAATEVHSVSSNEDRDVSILWLAEHAAQQSAVANKRAYGIS
jgi:hypothetical protein